MKLHYLCLLTILFNTSIFSQSWDQRADLPSPSSSLYGFSIGDRVYSGGGIVSRTPFVEYAGFNEYIPSTDTWEARTPCPGPLRYGINGFGLNGKGYVVAGWSGSPAVALNDVWEYDPIMDAWTQKNDFPGSGRYSCVSVAANGKAYLGLGHATYLSDWWEYDPAADVWTQRSSLPGVGRQACAAFVINDQIYVTVGARDVNSSTANFQYELYRYDPASDSWTTLAPFPAIGRVGSYAFSFGGVGYVFCGLTGDASSHYPLNDGWAYMPGTDEWLQLGLFPGGAITSGFACSTSSSCYLGGGQLGVEGLSWLSTDHTDLFWEYHPANVVGIAEGNDGSGLQVLPQGGDLLVQWPLSASASKILLFEMNGRLVRSEQLAENSTRSQIPTADLSSGIYVVAVEGEAQTFRRKVLVAK